MFCFGPRHASPPERCRSAAASDSIWHSARAVKLPPPCLSISFFCCAGILASGSWAGRHQGLVCYQCLNNLCCWSILFLLSLRYGFGWRIPGGMGCSRPLEPYSATLEIHWLNSSDDRCTFERERLRWCSDLAVVCEIGRFWHLDWQTRCTILQPACWFYRIYSCFLKLLETSKRASCTRDGAPPTACRNRWSCHRSFAVSASRYCLASFRYLSVESILYLVLDSPMKRTSTCGGAGSNSSFVAAGWKTLLCSKVFARTGCLCQVWLFALLLDPGGSGRWPQGYEPFWFGAYSQSSQAN